MESFDKSSVILKCLNYNLLTDLNKFLAMMSNVVDKFEMEDPS